MTTDDPLLHAVAADAVAGKTAAIDHHHTTRDRAGTVQPFRRHRPRTLRLAEADDAFAGRQPGGVQLTARRANVRLEIAVDSDDDAHPANASPRQLAASILPRHPSPIDAAANRRHTAPSSAPADRWP